MNWMNLTDSTRRVLGIIILAAVTVVLPAEAQQNTFNELTEKFDNGMVFHADFSHEYIDSYTGDTTASNGEIWVGENKYTVRTEHQAVVVDGETSRVYDNNRNRVIISEYEPEEDDFAPSRILNGADTTYTLESEERRDGQILLTLTSNDAFAVFTQIEIALTSDLVPTRIFVVDQVDNEIITTFENGEFIDPQDQMFQLQYPDNAEIVDMRN